MKDDTKTSKQAADFSILITYSRSASRFVTSKKYLGETTGRDVDH